VMLIPGMVYTLVYALIVGLMYDLTAALYALILIPMILLWALPLVLLFSVLGLFARDFAQALPFALMLLMYSTPILYFPEMLPDTVQSVLWLNPFADLMHIVHAFAQAETYPFNTVSLVRVIGEWLLMLGPCWLVFKRSLPHIREVL
jgi:lipopolysaccharide transport system permease protein